MFTQMAERLDLTKTRNDFFKNISRISNNSHHKR